MDFNKILQERRTIRRFKQLPVSDEALRSLIDGARRSSSAANRQPLRYIVARTPELVAALLPLTAWAGFVQPHRNPELNVSAPAAFIAVTAPADAAPIVHADAGAAIQTIEFQAWSLGLGCCWLGAIKRPEICQVLGIPAETQLLYLVAVGYPDEAPVCEDSDDTKYYLDDQDCLHVPKLPLDKITDWR